MLGNVARTDCTSFRRVAVLSYREGTVVASQQSRPRRSLVLEMEIPDGGPRGSVQPRKIRMAVVSGHRQLGHSDSLFTHRPQTVSSLLSKQTDPHSDSNRDGNAHRPRVPGR